MKWTSRWTLATFPWTFLGSNCSGFRRKYLRVAFISELCCEYFHSVDMIPESKSWRSCFWRDNRSTCILSQLIWAFHREGASYSPPKGAIWDALSQLWNTASVSRSHNPDISESLGANSCLEWFFLGRSSITVSCAHFVHIRSIEWNFLTMNSHCLSDLCRSWRLLRCKTYGCHNSYTRSNVRTSKARECE